MEVNGQFHVPGDLSPVTETPVVSEEGAGWGPRAGMDVVDKRKISSTMAGNRRRFLGCPSLSLLSVPTDFCEIYPVAFCRTIIDGHAAFNYNKFC